MSDLATSDKPLPADPAVPGPSPAVAARIQGRIDAVANDRVYGWVWDRGSPERRIEVVIRVGERDLGTVVADRARSDLRLNGIGDGRHAFEFSLPDDLDDSTRQGLIALARNPADGALLPLARPTTVESVAESVVAPPLHRMAQLLEAIGSAHRQAYGAHQAALKSLRESLGESHAANSEKLAEIERVLDSITMLQAAMAEQVGGLEIFTLRFDTALKDIDRRLREAAQGGDRPLRRAVAALAVATLITAGIAIFAATRLAG